jgi:hypothetical protein
VLATFCERGAGFRSLSDQWAGTTAPYGRLMLTVLGGLTEFERSLILAGTGERRTRSMARGEVRPESEADRSSSRRGQSPAGGRRSADGYRAECEPQHDFQVDGLTAAPMGCYLPAIPLQPGASSAASISTIIPAADMRNCPPAARQTS